MLKKLFIAGITISTALWAANDNRIANAAEANDLDAVKALIAEKADVNGTQGDGTSALHFAADHNDLKMAKMLVDAGASPKASTRNGAITPLFLAAKSGNAEMVDLLIKAGADVNYADNKGTTALMVAAASGSEAAVKSLIANGADVNAKDGAHGQTPLMFAAALNRAAAIRELLAHRADPNIATRAVKLDKPAPRQDDGSSTDKDKGDKDKKEEAKPVPVKAAAAAPTGDKDNLDTLARAVGLKSANYVTGGKPEPGSEMQQLRDSVQKLVAKVDEMEKKMPAAAKPGTNDDANPMFDRDRGTRDLGGFTALTYAARDNNIDAARALLEGGADINEVTLSEKTTPLVMAITNGHFDLASFLVDWGADPNPANVLGIAPLFAAIDVQWAPKGWFPSPVIGTDKVTYLELMEQLLKHGADPNARTAKKIWFRSFGDHTWIDTAGATAFFRAAQSSDIHAMKLLVKYGADPNIPTLKGATPLMVAAGIGWGYHYNMNLTDDNAWMDSVKYCIQLGANVNATDDRGYTALHGAAYIGNHEMIQYLMDHGADVKAVAKDKNTVADMANGPTRFGIPHPETVALLESLGSANSHNCRSDQCLVGVQEKKGNNNSSSDSKSNDKQNQ
jgi:ankyrin repeat protein